MIFVFRHSPLGESRPAGPERGGALPRAAVALQQSTFGRARLPPSRLLTYRYSACGGRHTECACYINRRTLRVGSLGNRGLTPANAQRLILQRGRTRQSLVDCTKRKSCTTSSGEVA